MTLRRLDRFRRDEGGSMSIELLFVIPIVVFVLLGSVVFFEGFRARSLNVKAAYTLADILSREANEPVTPHFLDSLYRLYGGLILGDDPRGLRVSVLRYAETGDRYDVVWSQVRGRARPLTPALLAPVVDQLLPRMFDGEVGILLETASDHEPTYASVGIAPFTIRNAMVIRPRFAPTLCWSPSDAGPWTQANQVC